MSIFKMPSLGADMESAILMEWKVKEGDRVTKGQIVAEIEASKGVIEIEVFEEGTVERLLVEEETECTVGAPMALIRRDDESIEELEAELSRITGEALISPTAETPQTDAVEAPVAEQLPAQSVDKSSAGAEGEVKRERASISPAARRRAKELGIDLTMIAKPAGGIIQLADVDAAAKTEALSTEQVEPSAPLKPLKATAAQADGMRQAIASAMSRSNAEIPHYYLSTSINMSPALEWLEKRNASKSIKERILPAALMLYAAVQALKKVPELNGFWKEGRHEISEAVHPGFAIALRKGGLITPALLDAHAKDIDGLMEAMGDLITRTRASKLRGAELSQQTITITNLGDLGVESVYGVIYPPQVALIGFGKIEERPWIDADGGIGIRKVMQATLAGDHRATDGRTGAQFLEHLKRVLENPKELA